MVHLLGVALSCTSPTSPLVVIRCLGRLRSDTCVITKSNYNESIDFWPVNLHVPRLVYWFICLSFPAHLRTFWELYFVCWWSMDYLFIYFYSNFQEGSTSYNRWSDEATYGWLYKSYPIVYIFILRSSISFIFYGNLGILPTIPFITEHESIIRYYITIFTNHKLALDYHIKDHYWRPFGVCAKNHWWPMVKEKEGNGV